MYEISAPVILRRQELMESDRQESVESTWRDCYDVTYPIRASGLQGATDSPDSAGAKNARLFDHTAGESANILASNIQAGMTPSNSLWFGLDVAHATTEEQRWLSDSATLLWENIHMSNFDAESFEGCLDSAIAGQFALYIDEDREKGGFVFQHWPLAEVFVGSTRSDGMVDIVHRRRKISAEALAKEFGEDALPENVRRHAKDPKLCTKEFDVIHAIFPRPDAPKGGRLSKALPIASVHILVEDKFVVRDGGYHEFPVVTPRWLRAPQSQYATGPLYVCLPTVRRLNYLMAIEGDSADVAVAGMWIAKDDGVLNPRNIRIGPKKIVVANDVDSMKPLMTGADFNLAEAKIAQMQAAVRRAMMADQLVPQDGPQMTAEEVRVRVDMIRKLLGPIYGRLQAEYLIPLVERCFGLAWRAGVFTAPPQSLAGRAFSVRFVSPMARAQRLDEVAAIGQTVQAAIGMAAAYPSILDDIDPNKVLELTGEGLGAPASIFRTADDKRKLRAERDAQQQAQAQQQMMAQTAQVGMDEAAKTAATAGG